VPAINPINIKKDVFGAFLPATKLFIPEIQRPFAWSDDQIKDYIRDVKQLLHLRTQSPQLPLEHFFGTIVIQSGLDPRGEAIIDGQQRITAISLTLGLLMAEMENLIKVIEGAGGPQVTGLVGRLKGHIPPLETCLRCPPDVNNNVRNRLIPSPEIARTFNSFVTCGDGVEASEQNGPAIKLRSCAEMIQLELIANNALYLTKQSAEKVDHLINLKSVIFESLLFVVVTTQSADASYDLFTSLNATGKPLNAIDLLKVWAISATVGSPHEQFVTDVTRVMATPRDENDKPEDYLAKFFQARTHYGKVRTSPPKLFVEDVRKAIFKDPIYADPALATSNLQNEIKFELQIASDWRETYYKLISNPADSPFPGATGFERQRLMSLLGGSLKHTLAVPFLMVAAAKLNSQDFFELVHLVERLFFRVKQICRKKESHLSKLYAKWMDLIDLGLYDIKTVKDDANKLIKSEASDDVFTMALITELKYGDPKIKYFLWMLDLYLAKPAPAQLATDLSELTIEHIAPQALRNDPIELQNAGINDAEDIHKLGNLCLLTMPENNELSDHNFSEKKRIVASWNHEPFCQLTRVVYIQHPSNTWGSQDMVTREFDLANRAKQVFSF
jgi:hypothetical protein